MSPIIIHFLPIMKRYCENSTHTCHAMPPFIIRPDYYEGVKLGRNKSFVSFSAPLPSPVLCSFWYAEL